MRKKTICYWGNSHRQQQKCFYAGDGMLSDRNKNYLKNEIASSK